MYRGSVLLAKLLASFGHGQFPGVDDLVNLADYEAPGLQARLRSEQDYYCCTDDTSAQEAYEKVDDLAWLHARFPSCNQFDEAPSELYPKTSPSANEYVRQRRTPVVGWIGACVGM